MTGFDGQDCTRFRQVVGVCDVGCRAEVGRDADAFEDAGEGDEGVRVCVSVRRAMVSSVTGGSKWV